jgi:antitoxin component YwqK of YwqJK toxin-antitoxin module
LQSKVIIYSNILFKPKKMQKILSIVAILFMVTNIFGQHLTKKEDELFYDSDNKPYTGTYKEYYENGQLQTKMELKEGLPHGEVFIYFPHGQINEIRSFDLGQMDGKWFTWNEQGQKIAQAEYSAGNKNGKWYIWNEYGVLLYDMTYDNGKRTGVWKMFNAEGQLISEKNFE